MRSNCFKYIKHTCYQQLQFQQTTLCVRSVIQIYNFNVLLRKKSIKGKHIHVYAYV